MLDSGMIEQLKSVFTKLENPVGLRIFRSSHADQAQLREMASQLASTSDKITLIEASESSPAPALEILSDSRFTGIHFRGVPGGHEFTSLILSILYADGKGKRPDEGILRRIRALQGPIRLKTYVSLSCENCPEVVQALNLMASLHSDFENETIDGGIAQDEILALNIQGVPSVIADGKLLHSGKIELVDLLHKLETHFGATIEDSSVSKELGEFDVAVIGGGPAGASAAIYSVRKGLKTVMIAERFGGQLKDTKGIENMVSVPYTEGVKLSAQLSEHVANYPVQIFEHRRVSSIYGETTKRIELESGESLQARAVIVATGAKWRELGVPGEKDYIGRGVAFCAHCDGPFYKGKKVVVVGGGNSGVEAAIDLAAIATDVVLLEYSDKLKADDVLLEKLRDTPNATVITEAKTSEVMGDGNKVTGLSYIDRRSGETKRLITDGVFVQIGLLPNTQFLKQTVELTPYGEIVVDPKGRTSAPGIYAAGDVTTVPFKQIVIAMGEGAKVALTAFEDRIRSKTGPHV